MNSAELTEKAKAQGSGIEPATILRPALAVCALIVAGAGALVLLGWLIDSPSLKSVVPGLGSMKANTALTFVMAGAALALLKYRRLSLALAFIVTLMGGLTLLEYFAAWDLRIDQVLFTDTASAVPGRMSPITALSFVLLGTAIAVLVRGRSSWLVTFLVLPAAFASTVAVVGYLYGVPSLYSVSQFPPTALNTAIAFAFLCVGILLAQPKHGLISILADRHAAGMVARVLLPASLVVPAIIGWLRIKGEMAGLYSSALGVALVAGSYMLIFGGLVVWTASLLRRQESHRERAQAKLRESEKEVRDFFENANDLIQSVGVDGRFHFVNRAWHNTLGYNEEEVKRLSVFDVLAPENLTHCREAFTRVMAGEALPEFEMVFRRRDGEAVIVEGHVNCRFVDGKPIATRGIFRDITARKKAENALRESEERYRDLVENAQDIIYSHDLNGNYTSSNAVAEKITGYTKEEALKLNFTQTIAPEFLAQTRQMLARKIAGEETTAYELELIAKDGHRVPVEVSTRLVRENGVPVGIQGIARDITERKRAEQRLHASEQRFRNLVEATSDWIWEVDETATYTYVSPQIRELLGYEPEEVLGKTPFDLMPADEAERVRAEFTSTIKQRARFRAVENTNLHKSGRRVVLETSGVPVFDESGRFRGHRGIDRDVTERKQRESELSRLATAVAQTADSVVITDTSGIIQYVNPAFEQISGYAKAEVISQNSRILKSGKTEPATYADLWKTISSGNVWSGQLTNQRKDRTFFEERVTISPVRDNSGQIVNYIAVKQDITAQTQLEAQLRQSQKLEAIGQLAGGVAHDFNNLLTAILGYSDLSLARLSEDDPIARNIQEVRKAAERAGSLTRQLLAFSRKQILEPKILDLNSVVSDVNKMLRRLIGEDIDLTTTLASNLWKVKADPTQIDQVLMNLALNARDAMPQGGKLTIETQNVELSEEYANTHHPLRAGEYVLLAVSDNGCGMDAETRAHIFEPFFTTKEIGKGTGLGLSTIYGIVKQSGGFVWVYSELNLGTTFKVYLPRVKNATAEANALAARPLAPTGTGTVLLVEDDAEVRGLIVECLETAGYRVFESGNGSGALAIARSFGERIDLLITDVVMPVMGGRELSEQFRLVRPETSVLFMSGYTDDAIVRNGIMDRDFAFVQKPFTPDLLLQRVAEALNPPRI